MPPRSRFRAPDPSRGPDLKRFPSERHLAVLRRLDIRRYQASHWLHHFIGGDYVRFDHMLSKLYDGGYIGRYKEHLHPDTVHARHLVYYLTDKGRKTLIEAGIHTARPRARPRSQTGHSHGPARPPRDRGCRARRCV